MNLILVKNLKTKSVFRILSDAFLIERSKNKKIIIYKDYSEDQKDVFAMESDIFWGLHDVLSPKEIKDFLYI